MLNRYAGTFENFQSFSVAVPVNVTNTGKRRLFFRSANSGFPLYPGQSKVLPPALHVYRVYTQVVSPLLRGGIFVGDEPEGEVEIDAGIGSAVEEPEAHVIGGHGGLGGPGGIGGLQPPRRLNIVNISIASILYSSDVSFLVHEGQAVEGASFTSSVPIVPRA